MGFTDKGAPGDGLAIDRVQANPAGGSNAYGTACPHIPGTGNQIDLENHLAGHVQKCS